MSAATDDLISDTRFCARAAVAFRAAYDVEAWKLRYRRALEWEAGAKVEDNRSDLYTETTK